MELKKDYTIVMVTHNMQQATRISDKTAFFLLGEVIGVTATAFLMVRFVNMSAFRFNVPSSFRSSREHNRQ